MESSFGTSAARLVSLVVLCGVVMPACAGHSRPHDTTAEEQQPKVIRTYRGFASFYGPGFAGQPTASGETFDPREMVAAHRTLPLGTRVRVTNLENGRSVTLRITDRGPYVGRRTIIDVSQGAARRLGFIEDGRVRVKVEVLDAKEKTGSSRERGPDG